MPNLLIRIKWDHAIEYVPVNTSNPPSLGARILTTECWPDTSESICYSAECLGYTEENSLAKLLLQYSPENNENIATQELPWGKTELTINLIDHTATAKWHDNGEYPELKKTCKCVVLEYSLIDELLYESVSRIRRPAQSKLRQDLINIDIACVISGETTQTALEAAHIVEVQNRGADKINNAFLLRADLHRLFDARLVTITPKGEIVFSPSVSDDYKTAGFKSQLQPVIFSRVAEALATRFLNEGAICGTH